MCMSVNIAKIELTGISEFGFFQLFTLMFEIKLTVIIYDELNFKNQELISNILYVQIHIFQTKI